MLCCCGRFFFRLTPRWRPFNQSTIKFRRNPVLAATPVNVSCVGLDANTPSESCFERKWRRAVARFGERATWMFVGPHPGVSRRNGCQTTRWESRMPELWPGVVFETLDVFKRVHPSFLGMPGLCRDRRVVYSAKKSTNERSSAERSLRGPTRIWRTRASGMGNARMRKMCVASFQNRRRSAKEDHAASDAVRR